LDALGENAVEVLQLPTVAQLHCTLVQPQLEIQTSDARNILPASIPMQDATFYAGQVAALVAALYQKDLSLLSRASVDCIAEPHRASLGSGIAQALAEGRSSPALSAGLSGSGPTLFALAANAEDANNAGNAMMKAFQKAGVEARYSVHRMAGGAALK